MKFKETAGKVLVMCLFLAFFVNNAMAGDKELFEYLGISKEDYINNPDVLDTVITEDGQILRQAIQSLYAFDMTNQENQNKDQIDLQTRQWQITQMHMTVTGLFMALGSGVSKIIDGLGRLTQILWGTYEKVDDFQDAVGLFQDFRAIQEDPQFLEGQLQYYLRSFGERLEESGFGSYEEESFLITTNQESDEFYKQAQKIHDKIWSNLVTKLGYLELPEEDERYEDFPRKPVHKEIVTTDAVKEMTYNAWEIAYKNYYIVQEKQALREGILDLMKNPHKLLSAQSFEITPNKEKYFVGDILSGNFTITNQGTVDVMLKEICIAGRDENMNVYDFTKRFNMQINAGQEYAYTGTFKIPKTGPFWFFPSIFAGKR